MLSITLLFTIKENLLGKSIKMQRFTKHTIVMCMFNVTVEKNLISKGDENRKPCTDINLLRFCGLHRSFFLKF